MTNATVRVVDTNDGTILWEGGSVTAAREALKALIDWMTRHRQGGTSTLVVKRYMGDGEWSVVRERRAA